MCKPKRKKKKNFLSKIQQIKPGGSSDPKGTIALITSLIIDL